MFRTVWVHFGFVSLLHETRCKTGRTGAINEEVHATKSHRNFSQRTHRPPHWTLNSCIGVFRSVWVQLSMFHYYMKLGAKRVEHVQLMHKFVPLSHI